MQRVSDPPLTTCEACGGDLKKLISAPAFQFKGSGWYVTDYADKKSAKDGGDSKAGNGEKNAKDTKDGGSKTGSGSSSAAGSESSSKSSSSKSDKASGS